MAFVGFKKMTVAVLDDELKVISSKKYEVKGKTNEGATSAFEITGLSSEPIKIYGSDTVYMVIQEGVGEVAASVDALDLPSEVEHELLGVKKSSSGIYHYGETTKAPSTAVLFETTNLKGEPVAVGIYNAKWAKDTMSSSTKEGKTPTPEAEKYTLGITAKSIDDEAVYVGKAIGQEEVTALIAELFPTATV